ncbi:MAG: TusE/DsrC/DsvC family sulfur relay protein [Gammaproteobacteria bacterium]|nr:TusE/DsrC/DsvC family sulfur relay protein [Gammaproteobacteria bacterium]
MITRNQDDFLINIADWNEPLAIDLANESGIALSERHWEIIRILRELYLKNTRHPAMRVFIKELRSGQHASTMLELMQLFGERPLFTISFIAGLPKPPHCI